MNARSVVDYAVVPFMTGVPFFYAASTVNQFHEGVQLELL